MAEPPKFDITHIRRQLARGSRFKMPELDMPFDLEPTPEPFTPFYIQLEEHYSSDPNVPKSMFPDQTFRNMTIFGPFRQTAAEKAFHSLVLFFRYYGSGRRYQSPDLRDQYFEYLVGS